MFSNGRFRHLPFANGHDSRTRGMVRGAIGGLAGLTAMGLYFRAMQRLSGRREESESRSQREQQQSADQQSADQQGRGQQSADQQGPGQQSADQQSADQQSAQQQSSEQPRAGVESQAHEEQPLDDISVVGQQSSEEEPATEAVGRIAYHTLSGHDPDPDAKKKLGTAVHWGYGIAVGALYGALRPRPDGADVAGGLGYGTALWLFGDELMVPLLGLAEGPTAHPPSKHLQALGAHLVYGAATSAATQALRRVV